MQKKSVRASWAWNSILVGRKTIEEFARWQVLSGESIRTWEDRWIPGIPSEKLHASQLAASEFEPYQRVADLINWDVPCWDLIPIVEHLFVMEQDAIKSIPLSIEWENDKLVWPYEKSGNFTVRSGYHKLLESRFSSLFSTHIALTRLILLFGN